MIYELDDWRTGRRLPDKNGKDEFVAIWFVLVRRRSLNRLQLAQLKVLVEAETPHLLTPVWFSTDKNHALYFRRDAYTEDAVIAWMENAKNVLAHP